jgi:hypothetical protein
VGKIQAETQEEEVMYTVFKEHGIPKPERITKSFNNPPSILVDENEMQLGDLLVIGYHLIDILHGYEGPKEDKLEHQTRLSDISRSIIYIYQQCVNSDHAMSQMGAEMAGNFIITMMIPVIRKYFLLLTTDSDMDLNTQDTRNFLALYATPNNVKSAEERKNIHMMKFKRHLPHDVFSFMTKTVRGLRSKLFFMEPHEIYNELCYLVLKAALKFNTSLTLAFWFYLTGGRKRSGGDGTFKYMVRTFIAKQSGNFTYDPHAARNERNAIDVGLVEPEEAVMLSGSDELDINWVLGTSVSFEYEMLFAPLSPEQREILRRWYDSENKTNPTEIAREMGMTRQKVEEEYRTAIRHLSEVLGYK